MLEEQDTVTKAKRLEDAGIDYAGGLERFQGDAELYDMVLVAFLQDKVQERADAAFGCTDGKELFSCAHELKGASGNANMTELCEASSNLTELLRNNTKIDENVVAAYQKMRDAYIKAKEVIREVFDV